MKGNTRIGMDLEDLYAGFNGLYRRCFPLYRVLYFLYKRLSDRHKISLVASEARPGAVALDIGANVGFYTRLLSRSVGAAGAVYAFEPESRNFHHLERLTRRLANVRPVRAACGETSGIAHLYRSERLNVDHHLYENDEPRGKIEVPVVSVDDHLIHETRGVGFVKIDVQGYDCFVVRGMRATLSRSDRPVILGELWPYGLRQAGSSADEYLSELSRLGFAVRILSGDPPRPWSSYGRERGYYCDFIARRPL